MGSAAAASVVGVAAATVIHNQVGALPATRVLFVLLPPLAVLFSPRL